MGSIRFQSVRYGAASGRVDFGHNGAWGMFLHGTEVVRFADGVYTLRARGWHTAITARVMTACLPDGFSVSRVKGALVLWVRGVGYTWEDGMTVTASGVCDTLPLVGYDVPIESVEAYARRAGYFLSLETNGMGWMFDGVSRAKWRALGYPLGVADVGSGVALIGDSEVFAAFASWRSVPLVGMVYRRIV